MLDSEATACANGEGCEMKACAEKKPMAYKGSIYLGDKCGIAGSHKSLKFLYCTVKGLDLGMYAHCICDQRY